MKLKLIAQQNATKTLSYLTHYKRILRKPILREYSTTNKPPKTQDLKNEKIFAQEHHPSMPEQNDNTDAKDSPTDNHPSSPKNILIFESFGSGVIALCGALKAMEDKDPDYLKKVDWVAGRGSGSIIAALVATGHSVDEIHEIVIGAHPNLGLPKHWQAYTDKDEDLSGLNRALIQLQTRNPFIRFLVSLSTRLLSPLFSRPDGDLFRKDLNKKIAKTVPGSKPEAPEITMGDLANAIAGNKGNDTLKKLTIATSVLVAFC